ncbi:DUF3307 domain-containing protein [Candidatus Leptofilum sp.]|uniref:DUF3307 domain-containing protein n=1 Tax=Candidatus Leptofilum sp. TaxID=3241576 RepID=UPI003B5C28B7
MIIAMFLAHLVGDYILQWNSLAAWKSRAMAGVIVHCLVVLAVTWLFILPFNPGWWPWVIVIGVAHFVIDAIQLRVKLPIPELARFGLDQAAHFIVITLALAGGGYLNLAVIVQNGLALLQSDLLLIYLLGYAFVTMPAWVLVKFTAYGLVQGTAPQFGDSSKYLGILERLLMTTFVAVGQYLLVPLVILPRLLMEWPEVAQDEGAPVYLAELLASIALAVSVGIAFRLVS